MAATDLSPVRRGGRWGNWMPWSACAALALSACYAPSIGVGARCDPELDNCPRSLSCMATPGGHVCLAGPDGSSGGPDAAPTDYASVVLVDQPTGYWRLGDTNLTAADASGHGATGRYGSGIAQGAPGAIVNDANTSAAFDGMTGAISVGTGFNFIGRAAFSLEAWIRPSIVDTGFRHVFTKQHRATPWQGYALLVQTTRGIMFERFVDDRAVFVSVPTMPPAGSFMHIVCTYDGAFLRLYVNGQQAPQVTDDRAQPAVAEPAMIGAASVNESFFVGSVDEVAVYSAALPAARVRAHYLAGTMP
jgi:hypothetical protein